MPALSLFPKKDMNLNKIRSFWDLSYARENKNDNTKEKNTDCL